MNYEERNIELKNGKLGIFRAPVVADAPELLRYLVDTATQTPYLLRTPQECNMSLEAEEAYLRNAAEEDKGNGCTADIGHGPEILGTDVLGDQNTDGSTDAKEDAQEHFHRLGTGSDRRNRGMVAIVSDDQRVNSCIEILQNVSRDDRQRKQNDAAHDRSAGHVYFFHR